MGVVALHASKIREVFTDPGHCEIYNVELGETVTAGQVLCWAAAGTMVLADGNDNALDEPQAVALQGGLAGMVISVLAHGHCYGFTVAGLATGVRITLTDNPGELEAAGGGECCGRVVSLPGATTADYVIHFDFNTCIVGLE